MAIKIENISNARLPRHTEETMSKLLNSIPREHLKGLERLRLVNTINDPRLPATQRGNLPGIYHPKQGSQPAWIEIAVETILPSSQPLFKRLMSRLSFKGNLAAVLFSLIGQHYYLTMRHSVRKGQLEASVRAYTEKYLRAWGENQHTFRSRLFKPFQPTLEKWAKKIHRRALAQNRATQSKTIR